METPTSSSSTKPTSSESSEPESLTAMVTLPADIAGYEIEELLLTIRHQCDSAEYHLYQAVMQSYDVQLPLPGGCVPRSRAYTLARMLGTMETLGYEVREDAPIGEAWRVVYAQGEQDEDAIVREGLCQVSAHTLALVEAKDRAQRIVTLSD